MRILKAQRFSGVIANPEQDIVKFINKNNIKEEDIKSITVVSPNVGDSDYVVFFYGDSETKEITKGFLGW